MNHDSASAHRPAADSPADERRSLDAFDESSFPAPDSHQDQYLSQVAKGFGSMASRRVVIAGLARNIAAILPWTIARIERTGSLFRDYRVVIYENDSIDRTQDMLYEWADRNPRVSVICERRDDPVNLPNRCLSRAARMAFYRSQCQQVISREYARFDDVILVDMDLEGGWSYEGLAHTYGQDDWDFVGANGIIYRRRWLQPNAMAQYDAWAFRLDPDFRPLTTKQVNRMLYKRGEAMAPVYSCFGGLGVYRMPAYLAGSYDGSDVEHVTFHRQLHRRGFQRTFLNPSLITVYGRKHRSLDAWSKRCMQLLDRLPLYQAPSWQFGTRPLAATYDTQEARHQRAA